MQPIGTNEMIPNRIGSDAAFWSDLARTAAALDQRPAKIPFVIPQEFWDELNDCNQLYQSDRVVSDDIATLEREWPAIESRLMQTSQAKRAQWDSWRDSHPDDPIHVAVGLLTPFGRGRDERLLTTGLAFFLDPRESQLGIGKHLLRLFLDGLSQKLGKLPDCDISGALVEAEKRVPVPRPSKVGPKSARKTAIFDIWIELPSAEPPARILIEAKVDHFVSDDQLSDYEVAAGSIALGADVHPVLLLADDADVEETSNGHSEWQRIEWLDVACWLAPACENPEYPRSSRDLLRLYLASILREILEISPELAASSIVFPSGAARYLTARRDVQ